MMDVNGFHSLRNALGHSSGVGGPLNHGMRCKSCLTFGLIAHHRCVVCFVELEIVGVSELISKGVLLDTL